MNALVKYLFTLSILTTVAVGGPEIPTNSFGANAGIQRIEIQQRKANKELYPQGIIGKIQFEIQREIDKAILDPLDEITRSLKL